MKKGLATAVAVCLALASPRSQPSTLPDPWRSQDIGVVGQPETPLLAGDGTIVAEVASIYRTTSFDHRLR